MRRVVLVFIFLTSCMLNVPNDFYKRSYNKQYIFYQCKSCRVDISVFRGEGKIIISGYNYYIQADIDTFYIKHKYKKQ